MWHFAAFVSHSAWYTHRGQRWISLCGRQCTQWLLSNTWIVWNDVGLWACVHVYMCDVFISSYSILYLCPHSTHSVWPVCYIHVHYGWVDFRFLPVRSVLLSFQKPTGCTSNLMKAKHTSSNIRQQVFIQYLWSCREPACRTRSRRCCRTGCETPPGSCSGAGSWQWGWSCCRRLLGQSAWARGIRGCWWSARWLWCLLRWGHLSLEPPCYWWSGAGQRERETWGEEP